MDKGHSLKPNEKCEPITLGRPTKAPLATAPLVLDVENPNDFISLLQLTRRPVHQARRKRVVNSHLMYADQFRNHTEDEYLAFIARQFIEKKKTGQALSIGYISAIINSVQRHVLGKATMSKHTIHQFVLTLEKVFNEKNLDRDFFSGSSQFTVAPIGARPGRERNTPMYSESEFQTIEQYNFDSITNFLRTKKPPSVNEELALIFCFLTSVPQRISQVLTLSIKQANDLIIKNHTEIKAKSGRNETMYAPHRLAQVLLMYLETIPKSQKFLFTKSYQVYKKLGDKQYETIFNRPALGKRLFHSFRNFFAEKAHSLDPILAQKSLDHSSANMTLHYVKRQETVDEKAKLLNFVNKVKKSMVT